MSDAAVTTQPAGRSWRPLILTLIAFILVPLIPTQLQLLIPVVETPLLLVPVVAACAIVGWLAGGKPILALIWVGLAVWFLAVPASPAGLPYDGMARGWALLLAGSFGLVSLWNSATPFIVRALGALGLAIGTGFVLAISSSGGVDRYQRVAVSEFTRRSNATVAILRSESQSKPFRDLAARSPMVDEYWDQLETQIRAMPARSAILLPALIALESLASLALGWAIYSRLTAEHIGPPLSPLREFRFNDQLVWGVAVGATMMLLPPFEEGRNAGFNLLVFFGALYFVRGIGVVAWMSKRRAILIGSMLIFLFLPPLFPFLAAAIFAVGLGDTWLDWRSRAAVG